MKGYTHEELLNITNALKSCANNAEGRPDYVSDFRLNVEKAILDLANKGLLNEFLIDKILKIKGHLVRMRKN